MLVSGGTLPAKVLRDNVLHLLRCWEVGQGPCLMSVLFARADPGYSFLSPLCLCQPQQKVSVWFVHWLHWGWSNLLWASSQQYPFPGEHWGAFLLLLERACRAHDLLSWLWRVPLILSIPSGISLRKFRQLPHYSTLPQGKLIIQHFSKAAGKPNF